MCRAHTVCVPAGTLVLRLNEASPESARPAPLSLGVGQAASVSRIDAACIASAGGDVRSIDTRVPPGTMHEQNFADVVGKKPVALLFATPQLCQSRVCGPVTDEMLQVKAETGDKMVFIHQERKGQIVFGLEFLVGFLIRIFL